ncbi:MAG: chloride channel protein [Marinilabiliaceae bacterium]|nr:chloride channel protein [Marinilabiliaceae bacterium]
MDKLTRLVVRIALWRAKNVSQTQFVLILSLIIGILSGFAAVVLKNTIHYVRFLVIGKTTAGDFNLLLLVLPMVGILITIVIVRYFIKDSLSHGVSKILYAISKSGGFIKPHNTFSNVLASTFTIALGGSVGAEAPIVLSGSAIGSNLGRLFRLNHKTIIQLIGCGAAGAISGIFQAPIAGVIFTLEVLMLDLTTSSIAPLLISAVSGTTISYFLLGNDAEFSFFLQAPFDLNNIPFYILLGIFGGFVSLYFNWGVLALEQQYAKIKYIYVKWLVGGTLLSVLIFIFPPLYGEGYTTISALLENDMSVVMSDSIFYFLKDQTWFVLLFLLFLMAIKVVATASTNGSGGVGGVFAPSLFMGGVTGYFFAKLINSFGFVKLPEGHFTLTGMAALMAGIMHAPLTAIFLIAEITNGYDLFIPLMISATLSYLTIKNFHKHNIYTKRLAMKGELITHHKDKAVLTLMKLNRVIETDFHTIRERMSLGELVKIISISRRNIFPVVNGQDNLVGIVVLDDIRDIMFNQEMYLKITVQNLMNIPPAFIELNETMDGVMKKFEDTGAWNLPVVENGKYVGFVSKSKIFSVYRRVLIHYSDE